MPRRPPPKKSTGGSSRIRSDYIITDATANGLDIPSIRGLDGQHIAVAARLVPTRPRQPVVPTSFQEAHAVITEGSKSGGASTPASTPVAPEPVPMVNMLERHRKDDERAARVTDAYLAALRRRLLDKCYPAAPPEQLGASTPAAAPVPQPPEQLGASTPEEATASAQELEALRRENAAAREKAYDDQAKVLEQAEETEEKEEANSVDYADDDDTPAPQPPAGGQDRASTPDAHDSSNPLRRQGLPCRSIVSRSGDVFVRVGDTTSILAAIQEVLNVRKEQLRTEMHSTDPFGGCIKHSVWKVLRREGQLAAFTRLQDQWFEKHGARCLEKHAERARASTPDWDVNDMAPGARQRAIRGYFKTHLFEKFGGQHWVKFLLAIGGVPAAAVEATNIVIEHRIMFSHDSRPPTTEALPATTPAWAFGRESRTKRPCLDAGLPEIHRLKGLRDKAKADMKAFEEDVAKAGSRATPEQLREFERRRQNIEERRPGGVFPQQR